MTFTQNNVHILIYSNVQETIDLQFYMYTKNSIREVHIPQPGEIVFNTMTYRSSETVQRSGYFQSSVSYIKIQIMFN